MYVHIYDDTQYHKQRKDIVKCIFLLFGFAFVVKESRKIFPKDPRKKKRSLRVINLDVEKNTIEVLNETGFAVNLINYWVCTQSRYEQISSANFSHQNSVINNNEAVILKLNSLKIPDDLLDIDLYPTIKFTTPTSMIDFIDWLTSEYAEDLSQAFIYPYQDITKTLPNKKLFNWSFIMNKLIGKNGLGPSVGVAIAGNNIYAFRLEGSKKLIEIYNNTGKSLNLSNYWFSSISDYELLDPAHIIQGNFIIKDQESSIFRSSILNTSYYEGDRNKQQDNKFIGEPIAITQGNWTGGKFVTVLSNDSSKMRSRMTKRLSDSDLAKRTPWQTSEKKQNN